MFGLTIPASWYVAGLSALALAAALVAGTAFVKAAHKYEAKQAAEIVAKDDQILALNRSLLRAQEQHTLDAATLTRLAARNRATARQMASVQASLADALAANRAWAEQAVPKEVQDALTR